MDEYKFTDIKELYRYVRDLMVAFDERGTPLKNINVLEYHEADCKSEPCECILAYGVDLNQTLELGRSEMPQDRRSRLDADDMSGVTQ